MASSSLTGSLYSRVTCSLSGLTYTGINYDLFYFNLYKWNATTELWVYDATYTLYGYDAGESTTVSHTFYTREPNKYYYVRIWAKYDGTVYPDAYSAGAGTGGYVSGSYLLPAIPYATFSNVVTQKTTVSFDYTNTYGLMALYVYTLGSWMTIASSPYSWTKNGNRITITGLVPVQSYYFYVTTTVGAYYSTSPSGSPGYNTYTTTAWPIIPSQVVLGVKGRYNGGFYLSWGDHSYEGYGFYYTLKDGSTTYGYWNNTGDNNFLTTSDYNTSHTLSVAPTVVGILGNGTAGAWAGSYGSTNSLYTAPKTPLTLVLGAQTTSTIAVTMTATAATYSGTLYKWRIYGSGSAFSTYFSSAGVLSYTIPSLTAQSTYEIQVYTYSSTSSLYSVGFKTVFGHTTAAAVLAVPVLSVVTSTSYSISYTCTTTTNATTYLVELWKYSGSSWSVDTTHSESMAHSHTFSGLDYYTNYMLRLTVSATSYFSNYIDAYVSTSGITAPSGATSITFVQSDPDKVQCDWTMGANANRTDLDISTDGVTWGSIDYPLQAGHSYEITTGLGQYYFRLRSAYTDGTNTVYGYWTNAYTTTMVSDGVLNVRISSAFDATKLCKVWYDTGNGMAFIEKPVKVWNGTQWVY